MLRGVFWIVDGELLSYQFYEGSNIGVAKSGLTYNHELLWNEIKPCGINVPYNYYPRGRVDFSNKGVPIIYMNPNIDESYIPKICYEFRLHSQPIIRYDYSEHYKCYMDEGWKSNK